MDKQIILYGDNGKRIRWNLMSDIAVDSSGKVVPPSELRAVAKQETKRLHEQKQRAKVRLSFIRKQAML
jgi:hypothetical protein